jgi:hypothetical protein
MLSMEYKLSQIDDKKCTSTILCGTARNQRATDIVITLIKKKTKELRVFSIMFRTCGNLRHSLALAAQPKIVPAH